MKVTKEQFIEACEEGITNCKKDLKWFIQQDETDLFKLTEKLKKYYPNVAGRLLIKAMTTKQAKEYAIGCAELTLSILAMLTPEKGYHQNQHKPRLAIEAAKKLMVEDTEENRKLALAAAEAAYITARATDSLPNPAYAADAAARAAVWTNSRDVARAANSAATHAAWTWGVGWDSVLDLGIEILNGLEVKE